jgi:hypothetical protein
MTAGLIALPAAERPARRAGVRDDEPGHALRCDCCRSRPATVEDEQRPAVLCAVCWRRHRAS